MRVEIETVQHGPVWYETLEQSKEEIYGEVMAALSNEKNLIFPTSTGHLIIPFEVLSTSIIRIGE